MLDDFEPPPWLTESHIWAAVMADLHRRCGNDETAGRYRTTALNLAPTVAVKELLRRRLQVKPSERA